MTRKEFTDRLIRIISMKYKLSDVEKEELRLILEIMPNADVPPTIVPQPSPWITVPETPVRTPHFPPITVMYGCQQPNTLTSVNTTYSDKVPKVDATRAD